TLIFGNPPFLGHLSRTSEQTEQLRRVWETKDISRLDYVTGWHAKTLKYLQHRPGQFAFVTTSSITQGDQTARLFEPIFKQGWNIKFAHRPFAWDSEAPGKAAVHCVIVGFTRARTIKPRLWDYYTVDSTPNEAKVSIGVN